MGNGHRLPSPEGLYNEDLTDATLLDSGTSSWHIVDDRAHLVDDRTTEDNNTVSEGSGASLGDGNGVKSLIKSLYSDDEPATLGLTETTSFEEEGRDTVDLHDYLEDPILPWSDTGPLIMNPDGEEDIYLNETEASPLSGPDFEDQAGGQAKGSARERPQDSHRQLLGLQRANFKLRQELKEQKTQFLSLKAAKINAATYPDSVHKEALICFDLSTISIVLCHCLLNFYNRDWEAMGDSAKEALKKAQRMGDGAMVKRCQYIIGVALFEQKRYVWAKEAFEQAKDLSGWPSPAWNSAEEWRTDSIKHTSNSYTGRYLRRFSECDYTAAPAPFSNELSPQDTGNDQGQPAFPSDADTTDQPKSFDAINLPPIFPNASNPFQRRSPNQTIASPALFTSSPTSPNTYGQSPISPHSRSNCADSTISGLTAAPTSPYPPFTHENRASTSFRLQPNPPTSNHKKRLSSLPRLSTSTSTAPHNPQPTSASQPLDQLHAPIKTARTPPEHDDDNVRTKPPNVTTSYNPTPNTNEVHPSFLPSSPTATPELPSSSMPDSVIHAEFGSTARNTTSLADELDPTG